MEEPAEKPDQTAAAPEPEKPAAKSEKPAAKSEQPAPKPKPEAPQPAAGSKTETATAAPAQGDKPEPESNPAKPGSRGLPAWVVQIGSFSQEDNARGLIKKLRAAGHAAFIEKLHRDGKTIYRVRVGPELLRSDANELKNKLDKELKMDTMVLQYP